MVVSARLLALGASCTVLFGVTGKVVVLSAAAVLALCLCGAAAAFCVSFSGPAAACMQRATERLFTLDTVLHVVPKSCLAMLVSWLINCSVVLDFPIAETRFNPGALGIRTKPSCQGETHCSRSRRRLDAQAQSALQAEGSHEEKGGGKDQKFQVFVKGLSGKTVVLRGLLWSGHGVVCRESGGRTHWCLGLPVLSICSVHLQTSQ